MPSSILGGGTLTSTNESVPVFVNFGETQMEEEYTIFKNKFELGFKK
jgi:hypothetical protein